MKTFTFKTKIINLTLACAMGIFSSNALAGEAPPNARDPFANSGGYEHRGMAGWEETDEISISKIMINQLEYQSSDNEDSQSWDMQGWIGTDYDKYWFKFEGDTVVGQSEGEFEVQALFSKSVAAFWEMQYGIRLDRAFDANNSDNRVFGVFGYQGLAPYWFEVEPTVFIDDKGNVSARFASSYDLLLTQRLILQPSIELNLSANDLPEYGIGKGLNDLQFELRLRYEFTRKVAPYIGIVWQKQYGDTASFTTVNGGIVDDTKLILGIRTWF